MWSDSIMTGGAGMHGWFGFPFFHGLVPLLLLILFVVAIAALIRK